MSIRSELNNTKYYLRESRKAILGRGGEISATAGLKDIPEAVWSIPADTSLAFREDSEVAYEKVVPVGAEEYALVKSLGGMSYKALGNNNLCSGDKVYTLNGESSYDVVLATLDIGEYYLSFERDLSGMGEMVLNGGSLSAPNLIYGESMIFTVGGNGTEVLLHIDSDAIMGGTEYLNGTIKNFMICKADDTDTEYKPYSPILVSAKPTSLESSGAQLFDESAITGASNNKLVPTNAYGVVENGYLKAKYSTYASSVYWLPFSIKLTKGTYTISADMYVGNVCPSLTIVIGLGAELKSPITARTNLYAYDTWERKSVTITLAEDNIYYFVASGIGDSTNYTKLDVRFKDIQIQRGETATEFHPFSAEPIDTLELPEAVQALDGWGLGIDSEYNNHIEWRNGRVIYTQKCKEADLGSLAWSPATHNRFIAKIADILPSATANDKPKALISADYTESTGNGFTAYDKSYYIGIDSTIGIRDVSYSDVVTFKEAISGEKLIYALAEPIETDITHLFTNTSPLLKVQGGGGAIANNERKQAVPSTLKYTVKVG